MGSRIPSHQLSNGLYVSGRPEHHKERQPTIVSRPIPYTGGDVNNNNSADLAKMFDIPPPPHRASSSSSSSSSSKQRTSGSGPIQPTGLLVTSSGPIGSNPPTLSKGKSVYGSAVTTLGSDDVRLVFKVSKTLMWMLLVIGVIGLMVGTFLMVAVKKPLILLSVIGLLLLALLLILWNCACCNKTRFISYLRNYPDTELRGAFEGQLVKVTGVVTCGSIPLESSFHKVPRCVYVSTEFYEYKGLRMMRNYCYSEKYVSDFYISDFHSGLRALVKAGYGAKVAPFVKQTTLIHITKQKLDSSPAFLTWLADRSLSTSSSSDHHRLKEGYIKEGSTVSVMGVVRRHDNVLMIVPPTDDPISTGCQWTCGLFPTYVQGLVLACDETQNADVIPV